MKDISALKTIEDVLCVMDRLDEQLVEHDGIRWFNFLYRIVTREVLVSCERGAWRNVEWMVCLDVEFAKLFFQAVEEWFKQEATVPRAWSVLFERRFDERICPVQFGLAGINAHINRDLPLAIVRAQAQILQRRPEKNSDESHDFEAVNALLDRVELEALQQMATGWMKRASHIVHPFDKKATMKAVSMARARAWTHAGTYWDLEREDAKKAETYLRKLDRVAEGVGRGLLIPTYSR